MYKRLILFVSMCFAVFFCFAGCQNLNTVLEESVVESHSAILEGNDDFFNVQFTVGKMRQNIKQDQQDFILIKLFTKNKVDVQSIAVEFCVNNNKYKENLKYFDEANAFVGVVQDNVVTKTLTFFVKWKDGIHQIQLKTVEIKDIVPIDMLKENFKQQLMDCYDGKKFDCKINLRLKFVDKKGKSGYFWFITATTEQNKIFGLIVDAKNGEIISKKM